MFQYIMTRVINIKKEPYDILIDRTTKWGNPFKIGRDGTREECILKHQLWFMIGPGQKLFGDLDELYNKTLG